MDFIYPDFLYVRIVLRSVDVHRVTLTFDQFWNNRLYYGMPPPARGPRHTATFCHAVLASERWENLRRLQISCIGLHVTFGLNVDAFLFSILAGQPKVLVKPSRSYTPTGHWHYGFFSALHGMPARTSDEKGVCLSFSPSVCLSVCPSVCVFISNAWIVTKRKKDLSRCLYHTKEHLA